VRRVEAPAYWILVVLTGSRLGGAERRLIGAARALADGSGGGIAVLSAVAPAELGPAGADRVLGLPPDVAETFAPERLASCVVTAMQRLGPRHVLLDESSVDSADLARRLAAASGERLIPSVRRLGLEEAGRRSACGTRELLTAPTRIMTVAPEAGSPYRGDPCEGRIMEPVTARADERVTCLGALPMDPDGVPLAEAELILAGGNGVTDWESFDQLARALGAAKGGSRVVCDAGHLSRDRQIGASGAIVRPKLYLALGISGAPQHLQGIVEAEQVVAVNADPQAPIMRRADLAIAADVRAVVPALLALLQLRGERSAGDGA
jgi:electron transfer flavoprotein alpha subunit